MPSRSLTVTVDSQIAPELRPGAKRLKKRDVEASRRGATAVSPASRTRRRSEIDDLRLDLLRAPPLPDRELERDVEGAAAPLGER